MSETSFVRNASGLYTATQPVTEDIIIDQAKAILASRLMSPGIVLTSAAQAKDFAYCELAGEEREVFACAWLSSQHELIAFERLFYGTINQAPVFPRELVKRCLDVNAAAVILMHCHPSGICEPSRADRQITQEVCDALRLVDCRVLDHLVVSARSVYSFAEHGEL